MLTTKTVHTKLQEISRKYKSGSPAISISGIADERGVNYTDIIPHISTLAMLKLLTVHEYEQQVILTESGAVYDAEALITEN